MFDYISEIESKVLPEMLILSGREVGLEPEESIIRKMHLLKDTLMIHTSREFGFDSPISIEEKSMNFRGYEYWLVTDHASIESIWKHEKITYTSDSKFYFNDMAIRIKKIPSFTYATLRITNPFESPYERIGNGWKAMTQWLENQKCDEPSDPNLRCLEEIIEIDGNMYMDIYVPLKENDS